MGEMGERAGLGDVAGEELTPTKEQKKGGCSQISYHIDNLTLSHNK